ncbi:MAG: hypothetical protein A2664_00755 [Candidatus Taylorbacteria bacterium RIFCSPHIGHO2_01_FULL_46_22b]|uniref:Aminotransferase DegT n=1 Tax=Candidatus Taylorbacteria bacterium RIFCSPHIGHO2_01_FULL_46_22b TaxID=1802301 RepID=A0A1G2M3K2_9BACT|nr:MAG: hypothetical protein A2664_00755 [Candidatus Taylorbacteria bacterium RIFCSPHIGHO2_01_FULL_46_22b]
MTSSKKENVPVNEPLLSKEAAANVAQAMESRWLSSQGPFVKQFEEDYAKRFGVKYAVTTTSGTSALHLALAALNVGKEDEVIVPAFTMAAVWLAVMYTGAKPVFVDCTPDTYNIDPTQIESKISSRTKAIIVVHIYGHSADMDPILAIAKKNKLKIVEDAAEAHGGEYKGQLCGTMGDIGTFSFMANKIITTGEGGMTITNNEEYADRLRRYKDFCYSPQKRFIHTDVGYNYRMGNLQAAVGCGELANLSKYIEIKEKMAEKYAGLLGNIAGLRLPITLSGVKNVYWMYAILIDDQKFGMNKDALRATLKERGIDTRDFFYPPEEQPFLIDRNLVTEKFPQTDYASKHGLYLPSGLAISDEQIERVAEEIRDIAKK